MSKQPTHFITAKPKQGGAPVDLGIMFASQYGYNIMLRRGTKVKVVVQYDRDLGREVELDDPIVVSAEDYYLNANENKARTDKGDGQLEAEVRSTFNIKGPASKQMDLPF